MVGLVSPLRVLTPLLTTACSHVTVARMKHSRENECQGQWVSIHQLLGHETFRKNHGFPTHSQDTSIQEF